MQAKITSQNKKEAFSQDSVWRSNVKKYLLSYSLVIALLIVGTAIFSLIGWEFDIKLFKYPLPGVTALNPMTALSWTFLGMSLLLYIRKKIGKPLQTLSKIFAVVAIVIGALRIVEVATGFTIGIDQLLFTSKLNTYVANSTSRHMSPATAFSLLLIGFALLMSAFESRRSKYLANYLALVVFVIGLFSIIGHAYYVSEFTGFLEHLSMSVYTAVCFFLISLAVMSANNDVGFMRTFSSAYLGGKMSRLLIPSAILIPLFLGFVRVLMNWKYPISVELGVSLFVISIIIIFYALIWYLATALNRSDIARGRVESELVQLNNELEQKVFDRTIEIKRSEKRFRSLVENNNSIIALLDKDLKTIYRAPSSELITGWSNEERKSMSALELIHPDDKKVMIEVLQKAQQNEGEALYLTTRLKHKSGKYIWMEGYVTNMINEPSVGAIITNLRDITEQREAEEKIIKLNEGLEQKVIERTAELQKAIKDIESFSYTVSHDLRTPLQVINTYSSILAQKHCAYSDDDAQSILKEIKNYTHQMSDVIESLLNLSLSGRLEIVHTQVNMYDLVHKVIAELKIVNKDNTTEIKVNPLPSAFCDEGLIKLVWLNIISNAIKYSAKSRTPAVEVGSEKINDEIVYYVKDNGVGFDMKDADKLFGVFHRLHKDSDFEGTGLGLSIVHRIVNRHRGAVWAESKESKGACFYFTLAPKSV